MDNPIFTLSWLGVIILIIIILKHILLYFFFNGKKILKLEDRIKFFSNKSNTQDKQDMIIQRVAYYPLYFIAELTLFLLSIRIVKYIYSGVKLFGISWIWTYILMYGILNILLSKLIKVRRL